MLDHFIEAMSKANMSSRYPAKKISVGTQHQNSTRLYLCEPVAVVFQVDNTWGQPLKHNIRTLNAPLGPNPPYKYREPSKKANPWPARGEGSEPSPLSTGIQFIVDGSKM